MAICCLFPVFFFLFFCLFVWQVLFLFLCLPSFVSETIKIIFLFKTNLKVTSCFFTAHTVNIFLSVCSFVICILRCQWNIWAFILDVIKTSSSFCFESHVYFSLQFSFNKMTFFLMVHQTDPWVFFIKSWPVCKSESDKCAAINLQLKASICNIVLHESSAHCMSNPSCLWVVRSMWKGCGVGSKCNAWIFACSSGNCAILPKCHMQSNLAVAWRSKLEGWPKSDLS